MTESVFTKRYRRFRELLIEARQAKRLSQMALAEQLGRVQTFVSKYERGERRLDVVEFLDVAAALGIDPHKVIRQLRATDGKQG
jgi:transcriptional regulator with XRE-family HTH domain